LNTGSRDVEAGSGESGIGSTLKKEAGSGSTLKKEAGSGSKLGSD